MTLGNLLSGAIAILPWVFGMVGLALMAVIGVWFGRPAVRILLLQEKVKLLELQLRAAQVHATACDERNEEMGARLEALAADNKQLAIRASQLLACIELKQGDATRDVLTGMAKAQ